MISARASFLVRAFFHFDIHLLDVPWERAESFSIDDLKGIDNGTNLIARMMKNKRATRAASTLEEFRVVLC